jgi:hypothetical protein
MSEHRAGLHKEVSAIFNGASLPKDDGAARPSEGQGAQQPSAASAPEHQDYTAPEPSVQRPFAPSHMTAAKPKSQQPSVQSPPEAAFAKQSGVNAAIKRALKQVKNKLFAPKPGVSTARQRAMIILALALFIVLISMFIRAFSVPSRKMIRTGTLGPAKATAAGYDNQADWQIPELYPTKLRDPMQFGSVATQTAEAGGLIVKGIVYSKDKPSAVIGNQIVHEGDKVLDVVIIKINENSVEFEANNKRWTQKVQR